MKLNSGKAIRLTHSFSLASAAAPVLQLSTAVALPSGHFHPIIKLFFSFLLFSFLHDPPPPLPVPAALLLFLVLGLILFACSCTFPCDDFISIIGFGQPRISFPCATRSLSSLCSTAAADLFSFLAAVSFILRFDPPSAHGVSITPLLPPARPAASIPIR